ncbi:hypothetical protein ACXWTF_05980 [Thiomicrolovo sp. ZZH C-3]
MIREKIATAAYRLKHNPALRRSLAQMKPKKTVWGFLGVVLFFFVPEMIAFIWGADITAYAHAQMLDVPAEPLATWYELLVMLFEEGGSWVNLGIGFAFLLWLFL